MKLKKSIILSIIFFSFAGIGCVTMPDPISDKYLHDATKEEMNNIYKIEDEIIAIKKEKDSLEKKHKISLQECKVSLKTIKLLKTQKSQLKEQLKLYTEMGDEKKIEKGKSDLEKNAKDINDEIIKSQYLDSKEEFEEAFIEVKHAELSLKLAERRYEKAKIARAYQDKLFEAEKKESKDEKEDDKKKKDDRLDLKKYEDYVTYQKKNLSKMQDKKNKKAEKMGQARLKLNAIKK